LWVFQHSWKTQQKPEKETEMFTSFVRWMKAHDLLAFFVLTFLFTYSAWLPVLLTLPDHDLSNISGFGLVLQMLGMWGPAFAAILTIGVTRGKPGLKDLFRRALQWRAPVRWYLAVILIYPVICILADSLFARVTNQPIQFRWNGWPVTITWLVQAPLLAFWGCEELGWRGFALPRLMSRWNALFASLIVGMVWGTWHLAYFILGVVPPFYYLIFTVSATILMAWIMNNNQGNLFLAIFFHFWINVYGGIHADRFFLADPDPDRQLMFRVLVMGAAALLVLAGYGYQTLAGRRGVPRPIEALPDIATGD
jgi:membrane protease YdiL (CAAX protease family)